MCMKALSTIRIHTHLIDAKRNKDGWVGYKYKDQGNPFLLRVTFFPAERRRCSLTHPEMLQVRRWENCDQGTKRFKDERIKDREGEIVLSLELLRTLGI